MVDVVDRSGRDEHLLAEDPRTGVHHQARRVHVVTGLIDLTDAAVGRLDLVTGQVGAARSDIIPEAPYVERTARHDVARRVRCPIPGLLRVKPVHRTSLLIRIDCIVAIRVPPLRFRTHRSEGVIATYRGHWVTTCPPGGLSLAHDRSTLVAPPALGGLDPRVHRPTSGPCAQQNDLADWQRPVAPLVAPSVAPPVQPR